MKLFKSIGLTFLITITLLLLEDGLKTDKSYLLILALFASSLVFTNKWDL